ncbi:MAG: hypothetical protein ACLRMH_11350 [Lachnospiraceae bacterium]
METYEQLHHRGGRSGCELRSYLIELRIAKGMCGKSYMMIAEKPQQ